MSKKKPIEGGRFCNIYGQNQMELTAAGKENVILLLNLIAQESIESVFYKAKEAFGEERFPGSIHEFEAFIEFAKKLKREGFLE